MALMRIANLSEEGQTDGRLVRNVLNNPE